MVSSVVLFSGVCVDGSSVGIVGFVRLYDGRERRRGEEERRGEERRGEREMEGREGEEMESKNGGKCSTEHALHKLIKYMYMVSSIHGFPFPLGPC